jgi:thiamine biosynthesis protein ThiI
LREDSPWPDIKERLRKVFGIANLAPAWWVELDMAKVEEGLWSLLRDQEFSSFKIETKRGRKDYPLNSQEINRRVGEYIVKKSGRRVDLTRPDITCYLEIVEKYAIIYFEKIKGPGGLPVSTGGKVAVLISGGLDSPVAAYRILKRGCQAIFIHFHSYPFTDKESQQKVIRLIELLSCYQFRSCLYLVPFADIQQRIVAAVPPPLRVILYRRYMLRISEKIATEEKALALVTGESLGQVASQTLQNISVISEAVQMPILRPLIGEDKEEIIKWAKEIGTYEISILPHQDCCSLFLPKQPETKADLNQIRKMEQLLGLEDVLNNLRGNIVRQEISLPCSQKVKNTLL